MPTKKKNRQRAVRVSRSATMRSPPAFVTPMAAQVVKKLPQGDDWVYELKVDGYRALHHQGRAAHRASVQEEQGPHRDVSGSRRGRSAVEGRSGGDRR